MKRASVLFLVSFFVIGYSLGISLAVDWHTANQITIAWDAIVKKPDNPDSWIEADDTLKYGVYIKRFPDGVPELLGENLETQITALITLPNEGKYVLGVSTIRYVGGPDGERLESAINWSDQNGEATPVPFGVSYFVVGDPPNNLRKQ